ncbi:MAG TPA: ABC transporter permease [Stellaceae bacterium]|nr:ABC transporter permease [Stellaceae bacterium]
MGRIFDRPLTRQLIGLAVLLILWQGAANAGWLNPLYMPSPLKIGAALVQLFGSGTIWPHLLATFTASLGGLVIGVIVGVILGAAAAILPVIAELLEPVMILLNAVPRVVLAPLFVIWLGIGLASKVAISFLLVAVLIFFTVFTGIRQVDRKLVERVVTLGGGRGALLREVYMPSVTAWVLGNLKVAVGFAFTGAIVGEFVAATKGIGYLLSFAQSTYNAALMIALVLVIMAFVLLIFALSEWLEKRLTRWRG